MSGAIDKTYIHGVIFAFSGYAIISLGDALVKKALDMHELILIAFYTNIASIIGLLIAACFCGFRNLVHTKSLKLHLLRAALFLGVYLTFLYAISNMGMAQTYTLYLTQPFILVVLAHFITHEKIGAHRILSIVVSFIGVLVVLRPGFVPIELPAIAALLCALLYAAGNILVKLMNKNDHWMTYVFYVMLLQTPLLGLYLFFIDTPEAYFPSFEAIPWIVGAGLSYMIAIALFPLAMQRIDAALYGGIEYTVLLWGTIFGYFLFAEIPDIWTIAGASIIVSSGLYLIRRERVASLPKTQQIN